MKQKTNSKQTLYHKLFAHFMLFAIILIVCLWLFQTVLLEFFYKQIKTQTLKNTSSLIVGAVDSMDSIDVETLKNLSTGLVLQNDVSLKFMDLSTSGAESFESVFSVISDQDTLISRLSQSDLYLIYNEAKEGGGQVLQNYQRGSYSVYSSWDDVEERKPPVIPESGNEKNEYIPRKDFKHGAPPLYRIGITQELIYARIITQSDGHEYLILFDSVITPLSSTVTTLRYQLVLITVIILIIAALAAGKLSRSVSKPIDKITSSARSLASGKFDVTFEGGDYYEITQLADTLNYVSHELDVADSVKRELISNTSHDLRTPLTMIIGYAEVMRDLPGENTPENVQVIIDEASRLTTLVNDMLDLSKLQAGTVILDYSEFNLTQLTERIIERIRKMTEKDGFTFDFKFDKNVFVKADETRITQVIYNFLTNAVNYSEDDLEIFINQMTDGKKVTISVTDRGPGIPKENLPNIWDRYYKIDRTHKRSAVGSGIGLSIVKSILEMHGAKYGVTTSQKGSTFWFELPVTDVI